MGGSSAHLDCSACARAVISRAAVVCLVAACRFKGVALAFVCSQLARVFVHGSEVFAPVPRCACISSSSPVVDLPFLVMRACVLFVLWRVRLALSSRDNTNRDAV